MTAVATVIIGNRAPITSGSDRVRAKKPHFIARKEGCERWVRCENLGGEKSAQDIPQPAEEEAVSRYTV